MGTPDTPSYCRTQKAWLIENFSQLKPYFQCLTSIEFICFISFLKYTFSLRPFPGYLMYNWKPHSYTLSFLFFSLIGLYLRHSQARGQIQATAAGLCHSHSKWDPSPVCYLHHSSWQHRIPDPLREARNWTRILMDTSWICFCCAIMGTPSYILSLSYFSLQPLFNFVFFRILFSAPPFLP